MRGLLSIGFFLSFISFGQPPSDYTLWIVKGDCSGGQYCGLHTDTTTYIEADCLSNVPCPDSVLYSYNDTSQWTYPPFYRLKYKPVEEGRLILHADLYIKEKIVPLDTSLLIVHVPKLTAKTILVKKNNTEQLKVRLIDENGQDVTKDFFACFAEVLIYDKEGKEKGMWGMGFNLNLNDLISDDRIQLQRGDVIKIEWIRVLDKRVNRSWVFYSRIEWTY